MLLAFCRMFLPTAGTPTPLTFAGGQVELRMPNRGIRRWKAKGLTDRSASEMTFYDEKKGRELSVADYYKESYNITYAPQSQEDLCCLLSACYAMHRAGNAGNVLLGVNVRDIDALSPAGDTHQAHAGMRMSESLRV